MRQVLLGIPFLVTSLLAGRADAQRLTGQMAWSLKEHPDYILSATGRAITDDAGRLYLAEPQDFGINVFTADGLFDGRLGRKGGGPAEFEQLCCIFWDPKGRIWARDAALRRYQVFAPLQRDRRMGYLFTAPLSHSSPNFTPGLGFSGDRLYEIAFPSKSPSIGQSMVRLVADSNGRVISSFPLPSVKVDSIPAAVLRYKLPDGDGMRFFPAPYGDQPLLAQAFNGALVVASSGRYELHWYDQRGTLLRVIRRNGARVPLSAGERQRAKDYVSDVVQKLKASGSSVSWPEVSTKPPLRDLEFDQEGRLWVQRTTPADKPMESDVFRPDGTFAFTAVWPTLRGLRFSGAAKGFAAWAYYTGDDDVAQLAKVVFK